MFTRSDTMTTESFTLCTKKSCCPEVVVDHEDNEVKIADDYDGEVSLSLEEFEELQDIELSEE